MKFKYLTLIFLLLSTVTHADIYQCEEKGVTAFQSKPCTGQQKFQKKITETKKVNDWTPKPLAEVVKRQSSTTPSESSQPSQPIYLRWWSDIKQRLGL